jgi:hypothetical protein
MERTAFAIGWDRRYLVAKQHPDGIKGITNFFIIDSTKDSPTQDPAVVVIGPLQGEEYLNQARDLNLLNFTKVLASLE